MIKILNKLYQVVCGNCEGILQFHFEDVRPVMTNSVVCPNCKAKIQLNRVLETHAVKTR
jgi:uncharacterized protein (DUF2225 family)